MNFVKNINMNLPKVSILIPLYNSEKYISETIDSALSQSWPNIEIIIVDDGSTDNSFLIAKSYESSVLSVYKKENRGACAARNFAFSKSTGDFIQYLDADDLLSADKIERQMAYFEQFGNYICASCKSVRFVEDKSRHKDTGEYVSKDYSNPLDYMVDAWDTGHYLGIHSWLIPRQIVEKVGEWDIALKRFQDGEFIIRVLYNIREVKYVPGCIAFYRETPNSISKGNYKEIEESRCLLLVKVVNNIIIPSNHSGAFQAFVVYLSNSIYNWYPNHQNLVDVGLNTLKKFNASFTVRNKTTFSRLVILIIGWHVFRKLELLSINYTNKLIRYGRKVWSKKII